MKGFRMLVVLLACANADDRDCTYALLPPGFDLSDKLLVPQAQVPICTTTTTTSSTTSTSSTTTTVTTTSSTSSSGTSTTSSLSTSTVSTFTSTSSSTSQTSSTTTSTTWTRSSSSTTASTTTSSSSANSTNSVTSTSSTSFEPSTTTSQSTSSSTTTSSTTTTSTTSSTTTTTTTRSSTSTSTSTSNSTTTSTTTTSTSSTSTSTTSSTSTSVSVTSSTSTSVSSTSSTSTISSSTSLTSTTSSTTTSTSTATLTTSSTSSSITSTSTSFTTTSSSTSTATLSSSTSTSLSSTSSTASTLTATTTSSTATSSSISWTTSTATSVTNTRTSSSTPTSTSTSDTTSTISHTTTSSSTTSSSTTSTSSSTSSTSSASSSTTSTTSTTRSWCSSFFNGLPPVQDDNCSDLQEGDMCEAITFRNFTTEDLNDSNITDAFWCYETGPTEFLCGRTGVLLPTSRTVRCSVCAVGSFEDLEDERGKISGTVYWGRNAIDGEIDESLVDGYDIWLVDGCGEQYAHLGQVPKLTWVQENGCCDPTAYNYTLDVLDLPQEHMSFMITPFQAEDRLLAGILIPIDERTTTTTTSTASSSTTSTTSSVTTLTSTSTTNTTSTITTWTTSMTTETTSSTLSTTSLSTTSVTSYIPISAVLRGCFGIAVNAPSVFIAVPEAKDAIKEAVANAAGPEVLTAYVQDVLFQQGEACVSRRLSTFRRLQSSLRADYVIVIPATPATESLGGAEAIGGRAKNAIELLSNQQATALLMESLNRFSSLQNFTESVTSIGSVRLQTAVDPLIIPSGGYERVIETEQKVDNSAAIAALIACTALLLTAVICGTAFLIRRQLKIAAIEESEVYPGPLGDPEQDTGHIPSAPATTPIERLTGGLPTSLRPSANESVQDSHPQNECSLPPELSFPELENFNNEDIGTSGPAPCVECSKSAIPCCGRL